MLRDIYVYLIRQRSILLIESVVIVGRKSSTGFDVVVRVRLGSGGGEIAEGEGLERRN